MSNVKLREVLSGGSTHKDKSPSSAPDGTISVSPAPTEAVEWLNRESIIDRVTSLSTYLDNSDQGRDPSSLYGKFTWQIDNFSSAARREMRSSTFQIGSYKWYILVYPQGCDVSNHLSLFLCVADYDKLLPGWSHYAQFTVTIVNQQDEKKSKYSDTLHRFCRKEHDWGWKKYMELNKLADGFTVDDTLVIKAQIQIIPNADNKPTKPFCTLDPQYRRELLRVYLSNVHALVKRFVDEKRPVFSRLIQPAAPLHASVTKNTTSSFLDFWDDLDHIKQAELTSTSAPLLIKNLTKHFFNEKEVTTTLMMDALLCAIKTVAKDSDCDLSEEPCCCSWHTRGCIGIDTACDEIFLSCTDLPTTLTRLARDPFPPIDVKRKPTNSNDASALRHVQYIEGYSVESVDEDEFRLVEYGKRAFEVFAAAFIIENQLETAWIEAETLKRQEALIREEEEASRGEAERAAAKAEAERERKARKKERQRVKKEAERAKKEAEEAEKQRQEEERKALAEKQRQEAEEKRKREEAEKEAERIRQAQAKQRAAAAVAAAKQALSKQQTAALDSVVLSSNNSNHNNHTMQSAITTSATNSPPSNVSNSSSTTSSHQDIESINPNNNSNQSNNYWAKQVEILQLIIKQKDEKISSLHARIAELEQQVEQQLFVLPPPPSPIRSSSSSSSLVPATVHTAVPAKVGKLEEISQTTMRHNGIAMINSMDRQPLSTATFSATAPVALASPTQPRNHGEVVMAATATPMPLVEQLQPVASPGLDDFAHMGLITDLLE